MGSLHAFGNLHQATHGERFENEHCAGEDGRAGARLHGHAAWWSRRFNKSGGMRASRSCFDNKAVKRKKKWAKHLKNVPTGWKKGDEEA